MQSNIDSAVKSGCFDQMVLVYNRLSLEETFANSYNSNLSVCDRSSCSSCAQDIAEMIFALLLRLLTELFDRLFIVTVVKSLSYSSILQRRDSIRLKLIILEFQARYNLPPFTNVQCQLTLR